MTARIFVIGVCSLGVFFGSYGPVVAMPVETIEWATDTERYIDEQIVSEQIFLSQLTGQPQQYIVTFNATSTLTISLRTTNNEARTSDLSVLIVQDAPLRGVETVARLGARDTLWATVFDTRTRVTYLAGPAYQAEVAPGTYRIEVSTPINEGKYELRFGTGDTSGWWQNVLDMRTLQRWYEVPWWQSLFSRLIYAPLLFLIIVGGGGWYVRRRFFHHVA